MDTYSLDAYVLQKFSHFIHVVGFVSWFAALLYLGRLFIYHKLALQKNDTSQVQSLRLMEHRLYFYIAVPAMLITLVAGITSAVLGDFFSQKWIHTKMTLVILLVVYHHHLGAIAKKFKKEDVKYSVRFFRFYNEVASILLVFIAALAVFRQAVLAFLASVILILAVLFVYAIIRAIRKPERSG